jgi:hypothetical protein
LPDQFWALTYRQFKGLIDGYVEREERKQQRDAWMLASLIQPHVKGKITPSMFLGEDHSNNAGWKKVKEDEYEEMIKRKQADREAAAIRDAKRLAEGNS